MIITLVTGMLLECVEAVGARGIGERVERVVRAANARVANARAADVRVADVSLLELAGVKLKFDI